MGSSHGTMQIKMTNEIMPAKPFIMAELLEYGPQAIVSRTLSKNKEATMTLFAFDAGQELSEHSAPFDAYVNVLDGEVELTIGGKKVNANAGQSVLMPANVPHAVKAPQRFKMLLTMMKS